MKEDKYLLGLIEDKMRMCEDRYMWAYTGFLDEHQQSVARVFLKKRPIGSGTVVFYGGFEEAERQLLLAIPEYETLDSINPLKVIRAKKGADSKELTHRDYLGALIGLGIKRDVIGDILVRDSGADIIVLEDISNFIMQNFTSAGKCVLQLEEVPIEDLLLPKHEKKICKETVASLRIDNIISAGFNVPRSKAAIAINKGLVFVNHIEIGKVDYQIHEKDNITFRGKGKIRLVDIGGMSRKGRQYITFEKY